MQFLPTSLLNAESESGSLGSFGSSSAGASGSSKLQTAVPFAHLLGQVSSSETAKASLLMDTKATAFLAEAGNAAGAARRLAAWKTASDTITSGTTASGSSASTGSQASAGAKLRAMLAGVGAKNRNSGNSLQNLVVTREDFAALREGLSQYGFTAAELDELQGMVNSKGGLTWGRMVSVAARKMAGQDAFAQDLSADESRLIQNFFSKLGFTPQESEDLLGKLKNGETAGVWQALSAKIAALPEDSALDLGKDELAALSKALRLSTDQEQRLGAVVGDDGSVRLGLGDLKAVLADLQSEASKSAADRTATASALRDLVAEAFKAARDKAGLADAADRRLDGDGQRTRLLAEAAQDKRQAEEDEYRPLSGKSVDGQDQGASSRLPGDGRSLAAEQAGKRPGADNREAGDKDGRKQGKESSAGDQGDSAKAAAQTEDQKAWNDFWSKVSKDRAAAAETRADVKRAAADAAPVADAASAAPLRTDAEQAATASGLEKFASRDVLRQVEGGMLRNLGEGSKQLTLRLDPPELGKLSLQLTVRGDEVKVVFKAENADAGNLLQENLSQLRQALENQGLKVSKMEVQTQLSDGGMGQGWTGAERHNDAREQGETARALDRMRILRGGEGMVREMQPGVLTAIDSHEGLSVIA